MWSNSGEKCCCKCVILNWGGVWSKAHKLRQLVSRAATIDYSYYQLICRLFFHWIDESWSVICPKIVNENAEKVTSSNVLSVQNPKIFLLLFYMTKRSSKFCHLTNCNLRVCSIYSVFLLEKLKWLINYQKSCRLFFCWSTNWLMN